MSNTPSIKKNFFLNTAYQILSIITPFLTAPYVARVLGVDGIGINSYTSSLLSYFSMFAVLGTNFYGNREISKTRDDKTQCSKLFWEIEFLSVFTSSLIILLWLVFVAFSSEYKLYYFILSLSLFSNLFDISWFYSGLEQFKYTVGKNTVVKLVGIALIFLFVKKPSDLWLFILINSGIGLLGNMSMWFSLKRFLVKINFSELKIFRHLKETLIYFIPTIATSIYQVLDKVLIELITNEISQNGFYEQTNKIISLAKTLCYSSLVGVVGSRNSYLFEKGKYEELKDKLNKTVGLVMFLSVGSCFGLIGIAQNFIPIFFGEGYEPSILLLQLMSPTLCIIGISVCMSSLYYVPAGLRSKSCYFEIAGAVLNLILNLILIPHLKSVGAVIGTLAAESLIAVLYIVFSNNYFSFGKLFACIWKKIIAASIMLVYLLLIQNLQIKPIFLLVIQLIGGATIYVVSLLALRDKDLVGVFEIVKQKIVQLKPK